METLLLVEDDPDAGEATREVLEAAGYRVVLARDAGQAYERLEREPVSGLVVDLALPDVGGDELLGRLRADRRFDRLPVVIHTAVPMTAALRPRLSKASGIVEKAGRPEALVRTVERALAQQPPEADRWLVEP